MAAKRARRGYHAQKKSWVLWLDGYGLGKFFDAFIDVAQYAESECVHCGQKIYIDIVEGGGIPDWGSAFPNSKPYGKMGLDYGCPDSPDTDSEGTGSHEPRKLDKIRKAVR